MDPKRERNDVQALPEQGIPKKMCVEENLSPPFEEWIPIEILDFILRDHVRPWDWCIARIICKRWNYIVKDYFTAAKKEGIMRKEDMNSSPFHEEWAFSIDGPRFSDWTLSRLQEKYPMFDYTEEEVKYFHFVFATTARHRKGDENMKTALKIFIFVRGFPQKTAGDYLAQYSETPIRALTWAKSRGLYNTILPLFHAIKRNDVELLEWIVQNWAAGEFNVLAELIPYSIGLFSAKRCMKRMTELIDWRSGPPTHGVCPAGETFKRNVMGAIIMHGNLEFLQKLISTQMSNFFFRDENKYLISTAVAEKAYPIVRWLDENGMSIYRYIEMLHQVLFDGNLDMLEWMLTYRMEKIRGSFYLAIRKNEIQDWVAKNAAISMNPDVFEVLERFGTFHINRDTITGCFHDRSGKSGKMHIAMMEYLIKRIENDPHSPYPDIYDDIPIRFYTRSGWVEEIEWLKARGKTWVDLSTALTCRNPTLLVWYAESIEDIERYVTDGMFIPLNIIRPEYLGTIQLLYEKGVKIYVPSILSDAVKRNHLCIVKWLWSIRDKTCPMPFIMCIWKLYAMGAFHSTEKNSPDTALEIISWFLDVVLCDPDITKLTSEDMLTFLSSTPGQFNIMEHIERDIEWTIHDLNTSFCDIPALHV